MRQHFDGSTEHCNIRSRPSPILIFNYVSSFDKDNAAVIQHD